MKYWAQFYHKMEHGGFEEATDETAVAFVDSRKNLDNMKKEAAILCREHGYDGWRLYRGFNLVDSFVLTTEVQPPASADV